MFSNATKYAIRTVLLLASKSKIKNKNYIASDIASELDIPQPFLSKILQKLVRAKIVSSSKGRGGGFYLTKANLNKSLLDIIICIEGVNVLNECLLGQPTCSDEHPCPLHHYYKDVKKDLQKVISDFSVENLADEMFGVIG